MASIKLKGDTSGEITISSPSVAGTNTLELQATSGTLATTAQASIGMKNLIINGNMQIAQRGTSATGITTTGYYTCDRWSFSYSNPTAVFSQTQDTDVPTGQGFANSLKTSCTTAGSLGANERVSILQRFEGFNVQSLAKGTANAKPTTLSFWVKSNKTGTYIVNLFDADNTRTISKSYTISSANTWEKKAVTFEGDTTGVLDDDNQQSLLLSWGLAVGSFETSGTLDTAWTAYSGAGITGRFVGQVDLSDSTSNYLNITGVQLEAGTVATPFENLQYGQQLALCQRYFQVLSYASGTNVAVGISTSTVSGITTFYYSQKRATPTVTLPPASTTNGISFLTVTGAYPSTVGTNTADKISVTSSRISGASYVGLAGAGRGAFLYATGAQVITISAEL